MILAGINLKKLEVKNLTQTKERTKLFIIVSPQGFYENELYYFNYFLENGIDFIHFRKPKISSSDQKKYLLQFPRHFLSKIVLHQHQEQAAGFGCKVHLKSHERNLSNSFSNIHSTSFHSTEEVSRNTLNLNYAFLSPIYTSISKQNYPSAFDLNTLKHYLNITKINTPIIALGGIESSNIQKTFDLGFQGVAVSGALWNVKASNELIRNFDDLKSLVNNIL